MKKSPFTAQEVETIRNFSADRRFDIIHYPGVREEETNRYVRMQTHGYFKAFRDILNPHSRETFSRTYLFDIKPVRDENPFFNYYLKIGNIREIYETMGKKWIYFIEEGYILPAIFVQVALLSLILMVLPVFRHSGSKSANKFQVSDKNSLKGNLNIAFLTYFALIGTGFMLVEVSLIQKMILPFGNPSYAFAAVLTSVLISSGMGSLVSYTLPALRNAFAAMVISLLVLGYSLILPPISHGIASLQLSSKLMVIFFTLLPLGFFMGIPFPMGLRVLSGSDKSLIPWAWAINGCFSVLAPILTVMLALIAGFKAVLLLGSLMYAMAFLMLTLFTRKPKS